MWDEILSNLSQFQSAVITGLDAEGYPFSVRCHPLPGPTNVLRLTLPPEAPLQRGSASLLCHRHDEQLWNQRSFVVRGSLEQDEQGWLFRPRQFIPGIGFGGVVGLVRYTLGARRAAKNYLAKRGLPRPRIPWDEIIAVKRSIKGQGSGVRDQRVGK